MTHDVMNVRYAVGDTLEDYAKEASMKYACVIMTGNAKSYADLASEAEAAGWDAAFIADAIGIETKDYPASEWFDPWVVLAVMAERTERILLGTLITPISRRRPWKLAREVSTLDHLSGGRMILSVGLGAAEHDGGFYKVGEQMDLRVRAELMDEGLAIVDGLWKGKPFSLTGKHYKVEKMTMLPRPLQKPRVPIWVVGVWPKEKSMRRAVSWDGAIMQKYGATPGDKAKPEDVRALAEFARSRRTKKSPFDIVVGGSSTGKNRNRGRDEAAALREAGATWWLESFWSAKDIKSIVRWIRQGPPS
jgi:alkanesulfonate monooxygenase SsuD/methylene tetrahydromethanopterin reductase-like flavin-dependent oxidoreductase (luciferase family)